MNLENLGLVELNAQEQKRNRWRMDCFGFEGTCLCCIIRSSNSRRKL